MDQAERLEQIDIDVSREIGRDRERQRQQPQQHLPAAKFMQRHDPCRTRADRQRQRADADQQQRGVEQAARQYVLDQGLPDVRRRLHRQRDDGKDGRRNQDRGRNRDRCGDPARARGRGSRRLTSARSRNPMQQYALFRGGRGHVDGNAVANWCDQLSNPTLSTSVEAALRLATILAIGVGSAVSLP